MKKRRILAIILALASISLGIIAYIILPETIVIQFSIGASGNATSPKLTAILVPTALGVFGAIATLSAKDNEKASGKGILISACGILLCIFMIVVNTLIL